MHPETPDTVMEPTAVAWSTLPAPFRIGFTPSTEADGIGFRVATTPVPSAVVLGSIGLTFTGWLLRRRKML
jgi:hypothetical protein